MTDSDTTDLEKWRRGLSWARAGLALSCVWAQWLGGASHRLVTVLVVAFAMYSLAALAWRSIGRFGGALLPLFWETIFFLIFAAYGADRDFWLSSALYTHLVLSSVMLHHWRETWSVVAVCLVFLSVTRPPDSKILWSTVAWAGLVGCFVAVRKRRIEQRLAERSREVQELGSRMQTALDQERQRIAGDFHDGPLQSFITLEMRLEVLRRILERDAQAAMHELRGMQETARAQLRDVRAFLRGMRPVEVRGSDLGGALRQVVANFQKDAGIAANFQCSGSVDLEDADRTTQVLQIVREALHNVQKHSGATRVALTVYQNGDVLDISIDDNGSGFPFSGQFTLEELDALRLGPASIKHRVRHLGGDLAVESRPGRGAGLKIRIPT